MTGKPREVTSLLEAVRWAATTRSSSATSLGRYLHEGQARFMRGSSAKVNALATANRWGKTTLLTGEHIHAGSTRPVPSPLHRRGRQAQPEPFTSLNYETVPYGR